MSLSHLLAALFADPPITADEVSAFRAAMHRRERWPEAGHEREQRNEWQTKRDESFADWLKRSARQMPECGGGE